MLNNKYIDLTDEELILLFQNSDANAYSELALRYKDKLKSFIFRYTNEMAQAEDLAQDTLLKVYIKKDSYKPIAKFSTWLYTIAQNLAKTELRKKKRRGTYRFSDLDKDDMEFIARSPEEGTTGDEIGKINDDKIIHQSLIELDDEFRNIIILRDIQELSYEEISKILDLPLGTVKSRINRARLKLKEIIKQDRRNNK